MNRFKGGALLLAFALIFAPAAIHAQDYRQLTPFLIDLEGWIAEPAEGMNMDSSAFKMINATRSYAQDSREIEAMMMVGNQSIPLSSMDSMHVESDESVMNMRQMDGFNVHTVHDKKENSGNVTVFLTQKETQGAMFTISYHGISESDALELAKRFNWNNMKLAAEKMF